MKQWLLTLTLLFCLACALKAQKATPVAQTQQQPQEVQLLQPKGGVKLAGKQSELTEKPLPAGTLAVFIDIEEAFNKNPRTLQARREMRLDLERRQIEFAQIQDQLKELKLKESNLYKEIDYYKPFFLPSKVIEPPNNNLYPKLQQDSAQDMLSTLAFSAADSRVASPENTPQKLEALQEAVRDSRKNIIDKETFLRNYKEMSKEEILSRQDHIVQEVLKEIYSGIKEYASVRNIGIVVDKRDLIYGKPLNVTDEFVKWMKTYHKKYTKENGGAL